MDPDVGIKTAGCVPVVIPNVFKNKSDTLRCFDRPMKCRQKLKRDVVAREPTKIVQFPLLLLARGMGADFDAFSWIQRMLVAYPL